MERRKGGQREYYSVSKYYCVAVFIVVPKGSENMYARGWGGILCLSVQSLNCLIPCPLRR